MNIPLIGWSVVGALVSYALAQAFIALVMWLEERESRKRWRSAGVPQ